MKQETGYTAFIPAALPPKPPLQRDDEMDDLLSKADRALGRLDGVCSILPNPDFFVGMYVRYEAVLSSQIEGTQSTLEDMLQFEAGGSESKQPKDVKEVVNYVAAMNYGLMRLRELPFSLRLIREIHGKLMAGARGSFQSPGEFRRSQNWIGSPGSSLANASFVPPPVREMEQALADLESFLHYKEPMPSLLLCGLAHAQFETIHPFLHGNGRVGRLLITFLLCQREILQRPLLYLSHYLKRHRGAYYGHLTAIRERGDWEGWMKFFLKGIFEVSQDAAATARKILDLRENGRQLLMKEASGTSAVHELFEQLFKTPVITARMAEEKLECSFGTAGKLVRELEKLGFLEEITGGQRYRRYRFKAYLDLFHEPSVILEETQFLKEEATQN